MRHATADAMAMGLQGDLPSAPRWGLGATVLPTPEQQGANLVSFAQGWKGFKPVVSPTATPEEQAKTAEAAKIAAQGSQMSIGWNKLKALFSPAQPAVAAAAPSAAAAPAWLVPAVAVGVVAFLFMLGKRN